MVNLISKFVVVVVVVDVPEGGVRPSPLGTSSTIWSIVPAPDNG
jgi:hypothetical protein